MRPTGWMLLAGLLIVGTFPFAAPASGAITIGSVLSIEVDGVAPGPGDVIVPGQSVFMNISVTDDAGATNLESVRLDLNPGTAGYGIVWNQSADTFTTNSSAIIMETSSSQLAGDTVDLSYGFQFAEGSSALDGLFGPNDLDVVAVDDAMTVTTASFSGAYKYEDDLEITTISFNDITGLQQMDLTDGATMAGGDTLEVSGEVRLQGGEIPPDGLVFVQLRQGPPVATAAVTGGQFTITYALSTITNQVGREYTVVLSSATGQSALGGTEFTSPSLDTSLLLRTDGGKPITHWLTNDPLQVAALADTPVSFQLDEDVSLATSPVELHYKLIEDGAVMGQDSVSLTTSNPGMTNGFIPFNADVDLTFGSTVSVDPTRLDTTTPTDPYRVEFWVTGHDDVGNQVNDLGNSENVPISMNGVVDTWPDLQVLSITVPEDMVDGTSYSIEVEIHNGGGGDVDGQVTLEFLLDGDIVEGPDITGGVMAHNTKSVTFSYTATEGDHTLEVRVDPDNYVVEATTANNEMNTTFRVGPSSQVEPELEVSQSNRIPLAPLWLWLPILLAVAVGLRARSR